MGYIDKQRQTLTSEAYTVDVCYRVDYKWPTLVVLLFCDYKWSMRVGSSCCYLTCVETRRYTWVNLTIAY